MLFNSCYRNEVWRYNPVLRNGNSTQQKTGRFLKRGMIPGFALFVGSIAYELLVKKDDGHHGPPPPTEGGSKSAKYSEDATQKVPVDIYSQVFRSFKSPSDLNLKSPGSSSDLVDEKNLGSQGVKTENEEMKSQASVNLNSEEMFEDPYKTGSRGIDAEIPSGSTIKSTGDINDKELEPKSLTGEDVSHKFSDKLANESISHLKMSGENQIGKENLEIYSKSDSKEISSGTDSETKLHPLSFKTEASGTEEPAAESKGYGEGKHQRELSTDSSDLSADELSLSGNRIHPEYIDSFDFSRWEPGPDTASEEDSAKTE